MKIARLAAVLLMLGASTAARADEEKPSFHAVKTSTVTSKVKAVDQKTRMVTLVNNEGEVTFKADDRIKNLKQMKPGESVPEASEGSTLASAPLGQKPAGYAAKEVYVVATIAAIDKENMIVTLKGPKGDAFPVKAREKKNV